MTVCRYRTNMVINWYTLKLNLDVCQTHIRPCEQPRRTYDTPGGSGTEGHGGRDYDCRRGLYCSVDTQAAYC